MIYRKEQRPHVVAETNITDCAAVNKILGQRVSKASLTKQTKKFDHFGQLTTCDTGLTMFAVENDDQERAGKIL